MAYSKLFGENPTMKFKKLNFYLRKSKHLFFIIIFQIAIYITFPINAMAMIYKAENGSPILLVFVHGFLGSAENSFYDEEEEKYLYERMNNATRQHGLGEFSEDFDVAILEYPASFCSNFTISEIVSYVKADFLASEIYKRYSRIIFISHSLGGIITKRLILSLEDEPSNNIAGAIFLGTPSEGALLADIANFIPFFPDGCRLIDDLKSISGNSILQDTRERWNKFMLSSRAGKRPTIHCAYEKRPTSISMFGPSVIVVPQERVDTVCDSVFPANADHFEIAVMPSGSVGISWLYTSIRDALHNYSFYRNQPQPGLGHFELLTWAKLSIETSYREGLTTTATASDNRVAYSSIPYREIEGCEPTTENRPFSEASSSSERVGRTSFNFMYEVRIDSSARLGDCWTKYLADNERRSYISSKAEVGFATSGTVAVDKSPSTIAVALSGVSLPSIILIEETGRLEARLVDINSDPRFSVDADGKLSGVITIEDVEPGYYLLSVEDYGITYSFSGEEEVEVESILGNVSIEIQ